MIRLLSLLLLGCMLAPTSSASETVLLHAAGSLRGPLSELSTAFEAGIGGRRVVSKFGPSGLLRDEIAGGARAEVFASANMEHPLSLNRSGRASPTVLFARNRLCALVRAGLPARTDSIVDLMLDPRIKLGTSTPRSDPSGDYAIALFRRIDDQRSGSRAILEAKALRLTGGPGSRQPSTDRSIYGQLIEAGEADVFLTYCTNARVAAREVPGAAVVPLPEDVAVGADYGVTVLTGSSEAAYALVLFMLSPNGQAVLAKHGFEAPLRSAEER